MERKISISSIFFYTLQQNMIATQSRLWSDDYDSNDDNDESLFMIGSDLWFSSGSREFESRAHSLDYSEISAFVATKKTFWGITWKTWVHYYVLKRRWNPSTITSPLWWASSSQSERRCVPNGGTENGVEADFNIM